MSAKVVAIFPFVCCLLLLPSCGGRKDVHRNGEIKLRGERPVNMKRKRTGDLLQKGIASWYGKPYHGRKTSNGETYDMDQMTAAHKTIPFGTYVKVVDKDTGKWVVVKINDRGPFIRDRVIDLSRGADRELCFFEKGTTKVALYLAKQESPKKTRRHTKQERPKRKSPPAERRSPPAERRSPPGEQTAPIKTAADDFDDRYIPDLPINDEDEIVEGRLPPPRQTESTRVKTNPNSSFWTIQVGSFSERGRAEAMARRMRTHTANVFIVEAQQLYKVRVGRFSSKESAGSLANDLKRDDIPVWILRQQP